MGAAQFVLVGLLMLVWGFGWPMMKLGIAEIPPLTFRTVTLPFAGLSMLLLARYSGETLRVPRACWSRVAALSLLNVTSWNVFILFGVQQLPAGRSAILAYTMPIWSVLFSLAVLNEPLSRRKTTGLLLGMAGMAILLGDDIRHFERTPQAAIYILIASVSWAFGTVLVRKWRLPVGNNALTGWMFLVGWVPIGILMLLFERWPGHAWMPTTWMAIVYNIFLAGVLAHWAWYSLVRSVPIVVSSMASLPIPVVGVFSGMLILGERPGIAEWSALALVLAGMVAVLRRKAEA
jgi:drug/metabolite transporter (DMT)-like permease